MTQLGRPFDYNGIRDAVECILQEHQKPDGYLEGSKVFIEEEPIFGLSDAGTAIAFYLDRRAAPADKQNLGAGKKTLYDLRAAFAVVAFNMESMRKCCEQRDVVMGRLELVMMANRTLNEKCSTLWLEGGELFSAKDPGTNVWTAVGELILTIQASAVLN